MPVKDKSVYHTNPEEALQVAKDLRKKVIGTLGNCGTFIRTNYGTTEKI